jgi:hypothetical protein
LSEHDLDRQSIDNQTSSELRDSLVRIDELIEDPSPISTLWADSGGAVYALDEVPPGAGGGRVTAEPMLRRRHDYILSRLLRATETEKAHLSRERAEPSLDDEARQSIESQVEQLEAEEARLDELRSESAALREEHAFERQLQAKEFQLEAEERRADMASREKLAVADAKSRWWQTRLSRDSIAAIVGGLLLIGFATAVIVAMFSDTEITDVVQNSFLLILGYFFGATVASRPFSETNQVDSSGRGEPGN